MWGEGERGEKDHCYLEWKLYSTRVAADQIFTVKQKKETNCKEKSEGVWERD